MREHTQNLILADWNIGQYFIDAARWLIEWLSDMLAAKVEAVVDALPKLPAINWTPLLNVIGWVNAFFPLAVLMTCVGLYLVWWVVWSLLRIILKIIWSG
jgi:hypothetical protein